MKTWHWIGMAVLAVVTMAAPLVVELEDAHWWDRVPGFWAVCGVAGCILLIFGSRAIGKAIVQREEDYYGDS